jgi:hypothetical protein
MVFQFQQRYSPFSLFSKAKKEEAEKEYQKRYKKVKVYDFTIYLSTYNYSMF